MHRHPLHTWNTSGEGPTETAFTLIIICQVWVSPALQGEFCLLGHIWPHWETFVFITVEAGGVCVCVAGVSGTWMLWAKGKSQLLPHVRTPRAAFWPKLSHAKAEEASPMYAEQMEWVPKVLETKCQSKPWHRLQKELTVWIQGREWRAVSKGWQWKLQSGSHMFDWFKYDWELIWVTPTFLATALLSG